MSCRERREYVKNANRDFVFVLDTSGSILGSEFTLAKEAISSLIEAFCPSVFGKKGYGNLHNTCQLVFIAFFLERALVQQTHSVYKLLNL